MPAHFRRNLFLLIGDYVFFVVGLTLINGQTILPDFVGRLSGSEVLVGLVSITFPLGTMLPQLAVAPAVARSANKRLWVLVPGLPGRSMMFVVAAAILVLGVQNPAPVLVIVFLGIGVFALCDGVSGVGWLDLLGSALPNERRGRMFGIGRAASSLIVLFLVSDLVRYILDPATGPDYPNDYAALFLLAGVCFILSVVAFIFIREPRRPPAATEAPVTRRDYLTFLRQALRHDHPYRHYLLTRLTAEIALIASPFYIRFATESLGIASAEAVSGAIQVSTVAGLVAGLAMGWLSERRGSRLVILFGALLVIAQPVLALVAGTGPIWLVFVAFGLSGMYMATMESGLLNWIIEYADDSRRAIYFSLTSTFNIIGVVSPVVGGVIAERLSYEALFGVALAISLVELALALRLVEPRRRRVESEPRIAELNASRIP